MTKWNVVPPLMVIDSRGWLVSTKTRVWYGGLSPHHPFQDIVRPGSADRAEHVATQDPRSDVVEPTRRELVVDAGRAAVSSKHLPKRAGGEGPFVQGCAANAKRVVEVLVGASTKTVEGYGEVVNAEFGHGLRSYPYITMSPTQGTVPHSL